MKLSDFGNPFAAIPCWAHATLKYTTVACAYIALLALVR